MFSDAEAEIFRLSMQVSLWATFCSLPFGVAVAWFLARVEFPGKVLVDGIIHLPLVLPPVVVGYLLLVVFSKNGAFGQFLSGIGIDFAFTWKGAALAAAVMAFPLMVRAIRLSIESVDQRLEMAARTLGAGPLSMFLTVTLPLILPGLIAGTVLAFARCLGEFGATITFVSNIPGETRTLPLAIYTLTQTPGSEDAAFRLVGLSVFIALIALAISEIAARRAKRSLGMTR